MAGQDLTNKERIITMNEQPIQIDENCQFLKDLDTPRQFMGQTRGLYNLAIFRRDLKLFCKGIKPHKKWRLKDVKEYFGLFELNKKEEIKNALDTLYLVVTNQV